MPRTAYSASQASRLAGVSIPTLKQMCAARQISFFRTPGGHLRIPADALERLLGNAVAPSAADPASGLEDHGERERELGLRSQELRTRRGVARPRVEQTESEEKLTTQARLRELQREPDLDEASLASERARRLVNQERQKQEALSQSGRFYRRWRGAAADWLPAWLSFEQHEMALEELDRVIARCSEQDEWRMQRVLTEAIDRLLVPWEKERQVAARREQLLQSTLWRFSGSASASERARAIAAIREALADLPSTALDHEERAAAEEAVQRVNEKVKTRLAIEEKERAEKEAQASKAREKARADQQRAFDELLRKRRKDDLLRRSVDKVWFCLFRLRNRGTISQEEYQDINQDSLKPAVGKRVQSQITGDESDRDLEVLVEQIVADELDL